MSDDIEKVKTVGINAYEMYESQNDSERGFAIEMRGGTMAQLIEQTVVDPDE